MSTLQKDIVKKANQLWRLARVNHAISYLLTLLAAFASIYASVSVGASVSVSGTLANPIMLAIIAAIPASAVILQNTIKFQERSLWQFGKAYRIKDLLYQIENGKDHEEIRIQYLRINRETINDFPGFAIPQSRTLETDSGNGG